MITRKLQIKQHRFNPISKGIKRRIKEKFGYTITNEQIGQIWEEYLELKKEELFETGETKLKGKIGSFDVFWMNVSDLKSIVKDKVKQGTVGEINFDRVGKFYFVAYERGEKVGEKIKFKPSLELKNRLKEKLKTTIKYKPATLKYHHHNNNN